MEFYRYHPRAVAGWPVGRSRFDALSDEIRKPERGVFFAGDFTESTHSSGAFEAAARVVRDIMKVRAQAGSAGK
jgi:monoamine oxidase